MGASHATNRSAPHDGVPAESQAHLVIDRRGTVVEWSPAAEELLGHPARAMVGRPVADLLTGAGTTAHPLAAIGDIAVPLRRQDGAFLPCRLAVRAEREDETGRGGR
ncbi:PAS domain-containing protein [Streptomyces sp. Ru62]|uniref:PAS domain-containing protein n=1 Tax=Streptomyces sp. Ru62 TaxID=2080745 RepID=UPI00215635BF|nr:PAS domain-containing protein [Streptomyces sp. Ru62]